MTRLSLAAIQMDAAPAATEARLERAEKLVVQAAAQGAEIAVLPEVFNTGYEYHDQNYDLAESMDGQTVSWMKSAAKKYNVYVVGSLLLRDGNEIFDAQMLVSPAGKLWRYDKTYPWAWERAYFCGGDGPMVAETELGKFGMLICWDVAHANLWAQYARKVDAMLVSSCPPLVHNLNFVFPDGKQVNLRELGPMMNSATHNADKVFGSLLRRQAAWLGVPVVNTTATGHFYSALPRAEISLRTFFAMRPDLWKYISKADEIHIEQGYFAETYVASAAGQVLGQVPDGQEGLVVHEVELAAETPQPNAPQPPSGLPPMAYWSIDGFANWLMVPYYNQHKNR